jgi:hypothetical protein
MGNASFPIQTIINLQIWVAVFGIGIIKNACNVQFVGYLIPMENAFPFPIIVALLTQKEYALLVSKVMI